ncbi:MAG: LytTR family DNA-binding domain-containing protein [Bacteroidales bacterium]|nr:LytTR family DNA-binding domain-containing protein [Bacteroidales bacterium]MDD3521371.1 LytTR family DNA-binding domain-containing protein [Bacteroidales bacterium]MDD4030270.1 LytTR family DNA-binding domain-containing protein [Bacteroidales bacterium]MDD4435005.1 LytTR family DNA-binding domain-containing protein [Bacteroidales bacterium]MDD5732726.1 LytTR family DNA-binding domain-containing protein [Bacteroidales bacterium]
MAIGSVVLVTALLFAWLTGSLVSLAWFEILADALIIAACMTGLGLFTYKMDAYGMPPYVQSLIFFAGTAGIPVLAMYLYLDPAGFRHFVRIIPLRIFIVALICLVLSILKKARKDGKKEPPLVEKPLSAPLPSQEYQDKIVVRSGNGIRVIPVNDLLYIQADGDYIWLVAKDGKWMKEETMKHMQETLSPSGFVRIHRSFIVNVSAISRIERYGQQQLIILTNGDSIRISPSGYRTLRDALGF